MTNPNPSATDPSQADANSSTNPQPQAGKSDSQVDQNSTNVSIDELQRQIAELRRENASHRRKTKEQEEATAEAERKRLAEQGEFKKLYEQHEAKVKELEPVVQSYSQLAELINKQIDAQVKDWPEEVKKLVPSAESPVEARLASVENLKPLVDKLTANSRTSSPGNRPNPPAVGSVNEPNKNTIMKELLESGIYGVSRSGRL